MEIELDPEGFPVPPFRDYEFYQKRKKGKWRAVEAPTFPEGVAIADTHAHLQMLADPSWALARCAVRGVDYVCAMCDPSETFVQAQAQEAEKAVEAVKELQTDGNSADNTANNVVENSAADKVAASMGVPTGQVMGIDFLQTEEQYYAREAKRMRYTPPTYANLDKWNMQAAMLLSRTYEGQRAVALPTVRIAIGVHPHNAKYYCAELEQQLLYHLQDPRTCAVGEVGLDYHYNFSDPKDQRTVFARQIQLAHQMQLPLILHMREAHDEGFAILEEEGWPEAGVLLHCFNLDENVLEPWLERDCYVAFGGPLTFKKADEVREAAKRVPLNRLLTETDSPYMTPEPLRGVECMPDYTVFTAERLCEVLGKETEQERTELLTQLYDNALTLLNKGATPWQCGSL